MAAFVPPAHHADSYRRATVWGRGSRYVHHPLHDAEGCGTLEQVIHHLQQETHQFSVWYSTGASRTYGPLAQLAEQLTLNQRVQGSSPWGLTRENQN